MTATTVSPIAPLDLVAERAFLGAPLEEAVLRVLHSGQYILGPEVAKLEAAFAELCGVDHGIAVSSGTDALILGLVALGVRPGDHVVTTPFTFFASAGVIAWLGAVPKLADVEPDTALLDPRAAATACDGKTRCVLPVHLYGQLADMKAFAALGEAKGIKILEDGAQAHGASREQIRCGERGDAGTFSFYPTKNLGGAGEAGMVVTRHDDVATRLRELRDHGMPAKYTHTHVGTNARMDAFQGAVLNVKLPHLEAWNERRRELARRYDAAFANSTAVIAPKVADGAVPVWHQYTVRIRGERSRDEIQAELAKRKIFTAVHYPTPVHLQAAAAPWGYGPGDFPHAETLAAEVLCLPIHPFLADAQVDAVAEALLALAES